MTETHKSHLCCFEQGENPACGLKGIHRCCLCEKEVPEQKAKEKEVWIQKHCNCDKGYSNRQLIDPNCHSHQLDEYGALDELLATRERELREEIAKEVDEVIWYAETRKQARERALSIIRNQGNKQ